MGTYTTIINDTLIPIIPVAGSILYDPRFTIWKQRLAVVKFYCLADCTLDIKRLSFVGGLLRYAWATLTNGIILQSNMEVL